MCGIAGIVRWDDDLAGPSNGDAVSRLVRSLEHRGPDGSGAWTSPDGHALLVHTRLAIVDLTPTGAQPMSSADGRYCIVFNGEIYNHEELRRDLERDGAAFRGTSDTEVLLELFAREGERCLDRLDGMFAFAVWDSRDRTLFCARDRLGEKPLYYVSTEKTFAFASEVRALLAAGVVAGRPDWAGIALFLRQGSIPPPYTHVEGVRFLMPGHFVRMGPKGSECSPRRYWRLSLVPDRDAVTDPAEAVRSVESAIRLSVRRRLRADVPVAAFLSGGLDSSLVAALMRQEGAGDLQTFTVTLPGQAGDEAARAREVARHIGTRHTEIPLRPDDSADWLLEAMDAMDVPSVDGPNTWLVSRAVRREGIKVAVSGLGGDELFFGYPSFRTVPAVHRVLAFARRLSAPRLVGRRLARSVPVSPRLGRILDAVHSGGGFAASWLMMRGLFSEGTVRDLLPEERLKGVTLVDPVTRIEELGLPNGVSSRRMVSFLETSVYLHDQLLRDSDAMSMSHALELRVPLIGLPVVEAVSRLSGVVLAGTRPKALLACAARGLLPHSVFEGPKQGFTLNWQRLLPALQAELATRPRILSSQTTERVWNAWRHGRLGFAYPLGLLVLERRLATLSDS